jgi:hypothetical protein
MAAVEALVHAALDALRGTKAREGEITWGGAPIGHWRYAPSALPHVGEPSRNPSTAALKHRQG